MKKAVLNEIKTNLLAEKERLEKELAHFAHRNPKTAETDFNSDFPNVGDSEDENAAEVAQFTDNLSLENELEHALRDVEGALKRFDDGSYGLCSYCKQEIDEKRLAARPTSSSCIKCKKTLTQEM
ncbi:MAG: TraR/DksA C4-type zinc finger protein [Candidatus Uhrbacteria bacterium]